MKFPVKFNRKIDEVLDKFAPFDFSTYDLIKDESLPVLGPYRYKSGTIYLG